jgi:hypothetical protein
MGFVPGTEYDCFISYRRLDDLGPGLVQGGGWVTQFYDAATRCLGEWLGQKPNIFMDTGMERGAELPPELSRSAAASAVLVPIVSPGYQLSTWCTREFQAFRERAVAGARWSIGNSLAVRKVVKLPLEDNHHQDYPVNELGYWFFEQNVHTKKIDPFKAGDPQYEAQIQCFAQETAALLKKLAALGAIAPPPPPATEPAGQTPQRRTVVLGCDAIGFEEDEGVKLVACVAADEPQVLAERMVAFKSTLAVDAAFAFNAGMVGRLERKGLRYEDDDEALRDRAADALAELPWDGYVAFAASNFWAERTEADTVLALLRGVVFDRLRGLIGASVQLVLSPRLAPFWQSISSAAVAYRQEIQALDAVKTVGTSDVQVAGATHAAIEVANYLGGLTAARLMDPADAQASRRFARVYPNKLRTLRDLMTDARYSRHKPLPADWRIG